MPKGRPRRARGGAPDQFAGARDLERGAANDRRERAEIGVARRLDGAQHDARAADADIDRAFGLAGAVKRAGHERIVLDGVAEHDELGAADRACVSGELGRALDDAAHGGDRVHVQAGAGRADIDRSADAFGCRQRFAEWRQRDWRRSCVMPFSTCAEKPPMKSTLTSCAARSSVSRDPQQVLRTGAAGDQRYRRHRDAVVDDRQPEFLRDVGADAPQIARDPFDLLVDVAAQRCRNCR